MNDLIDIAECAACVAAGEPCDYHRGWADGHDAAATVVGRFVALARDGQP